MIEEFKSIKGYEGLYEISNLGKVKSLNYNNSQKEKILKAGVAGNGYYTVGLYKNGKMKTNSLHVLVAITFLGHTTCGHKLVVNHIDFDKLNNKVSNLEIVTQRKNANQKHMKSSSKFVGVSWNKPTKKWMASIRINNKKKNLGRFTDEIEASNAYQTALRNIIK